MGLNMTGVWILASVFVEEEEEEEEEGRTIKASITPLYYVPGMCLQSDAVSVST